jgi:hypothetical protein
MLALDPVIRDRLDRFLEAGVTRNPRRVGKALEGRLKGFLALQDRLIPHHVSHRGRAVRRRGRRC